MVKIGNSSNYTVQVFPDEWEAEEPAEAALRENIFSVALNLHGFVKFVPAMPDEPPPLAAERPPREDEFTTAEEVGWCELIHSPYSITPDDTRAGTIRDVGIPDEPATVFYVTGEQFAGFVAELWELAEIASDSNPSVRRDEVLDRSVIRFIDERILTSDRLSPQHAASLGRAPA
ncbi:hypothetical protein [Actinoplanes sp. L3-i22]|uniref:hypothetical protein n=1 Tax=Actinoplanes sp. L3-i22 TaxID=2836373 RepID=UPI001C7802A5|nr:hypothetical protein [Actinoplanes sp. L3-i22]BCY06433.1 hypothetical protein L3i22_015210 [Actinoplanes sp. L3-i22]